MRFSRPVLLAILLVPALGLLAHLGLRWHARNLISAETPEAISPARAVAGRFTKMDAQETCRDFYGAICRQLGETRDPTGWVRNDYDGERRAQQLVREISAKNPDWDREEIDAELARQIYTERRRERVQSAYRWVQVAVENFIDRQPHSVFNIAEKRVLKARIQMTALELPPPSSVYADEPDLFTKSDVYYERTYSGEMRMRVGGAYLLATKSWFNFIFTFAHEFAHSIDPCELRNARIAVPAVDRLVSCFLKQGLVSTPKGRSECGEKDQLSETFADWVAVQIVAEALQTFASIYKSHQLTGAVTNSVRDLCEDDLADGEREHELHPSPRIRIESIFGKNPAIRALLGCEAAPKKEVYCSLNYR